MPININARIKNIEVDFDNSVTSTHFNQNTFQQIKTRGLFLTDLRLIHCASLMYQSKLNYSPSPRIKRALLTVEPSLLNNGNGGFTFLSEDTELDKTSSEVIGVGFAVHLMHSLLDVNMNMINKIPVNGTKKRCDFEALKGGTRYIFESKGRKLHVNGAKEEIREQKTSYLANVKYGVVTNIPRVGIPCKIYVTDPEIELPKVNHDYQIIALLNHYSKAARLAGFSRLSEKINDSVNEILQKQNITGKFEAQSFDYEDRNEGVYIKKIPVLNESFNCYFSRFLEVGLKWRLKKGNMLVFGLEEHIQRILEKQDFEEMLDYSFIDEDKGGYSVLSDGTLVTIISKEEAWEAMHK